MEDAYILNWFEIPVHDFDRAKEFYETILNIKMQADEFDGNRMAYFPFYNGKPTGCLTEDKNLAPSDKGVLLYLNANPDLSLVLNRVERSGGKVVAPKEQISPEYGFFAFLIDTEGNKLGLHSDK